MLLLISLLWSTQIQLLVYTKIFVYSYEFIDVYRLFSIQLLIPDNANLELKANSAYPLFTLCNSQ